MIEVQSGDVAAMRDASVTELVDDLNKKQAQIPLGIVGACCPALVAVVAVIEFNSSGQSAWITVGSVALLAALAVWAIGAWFDSYKPTSVLLYNLEEASATAYRKVTEGFDALAACHGKWHIASGGAVRDLTTWKRNAGAAHLVNRKNASLVYSLPKVLRSNITPQRSHSVAGISFFFPMSFLLSEAAALAPSDMMIFKFAPKLPVSLKMERLSAMHKSSATHGSIRTKAAALIGGFATTVNSRSACMM
jgi:hypothetical protein